MGRGPFFGSSRKMRGFPMNLSPGGLDDGGGGGFPYFATADGKFEFGYGGPPFHGHDGPIKIRRYPCFGACDQGINVTLYPDKVFYSKQVLKEHMRKKQHKCINPLNKDFDKYYIINYLEPGKLWQELKHEKDLDEPETSENGLK